MAAIAGIIGQLDDRNTQALARMARAMAHRGAGAERTWQSPADGRGWGVLLAERGAASSELGALIGGHVVALDGQLFGGAADTLVRALADPDPGLDAETERAPCLRGMFALAAWDPAARTLSLARDPLGREPLYVARNDDPTAHWSIAFASEVRGLLASGLLGKPRLDPRAVASMVWSGFVVGPESAVEGVRRLSPGQVLTLDARGKVIAARDTWTIPAGPRAADLDERELAPALESCVAQHVRGARAPTVLLSSGVDAAAVANLAQRARGAPVSTLTVRLEDDPQDEGPAAWRIAQAIGAEHREVTWSEADFTGALDGALASLDQPSLGGLDVYYLARAAQQAGANVALLGVGGSALFGGEPSSAELVRLHRWRGLAGPVPGDLLALSARLALRPLSGARGEFAAHDRWAKLPSLIGKADDLTAAYQLWHALFLPPTQHALLAPGLGATLLDGLTPDIRVRLDVESSDRSALSTLSVLALRIALGERALRDGDAAATATSVELRWPLVDPVLFDAADRLPDAVRFDPLGREAILRRIGLRGLDPSLFEGPRWSFERALEPWLRRALGDAMGRTLLDPAQVAPAGLEPEVVARLWRAFVAGAPGVAWRQVWAIYVLVRWCHRHGVYR